MPHAHPDSTQIANAVLDSLENVAEHIAAADPDTAIHAVAALPPAILTGDVNEAAAYAPPTTDSVGRPDSLAMARIVHPWTCLRVTELDAPLTRYKEGGSDELMAWQLGLPPYERAPMAGYDSGVMAVIIAVFLLLAACSKYASAFIRDSAQSLFKTKRGTIFDDHTVSETRIQVALVILLIVCEGAIAFSVLPWLGIQPAGGVFWPMMACAGAAGLYYLWQLAAYSITAYAFTDATGRKQWINGFNASQSMLGLALVVPMLTVLSFPPWAGVVAIAAICLYIIARLIFLVRGFRVFYENFSSLLYFILYLCALEIAPLVVMLKLRFLLA